MPIEIIYLWLIALPFLGGLFYIWYRLRQNRITGEPVLAWLDSARWLQWLTSIQQSLLRTSTRAETAAPTTTDSLPQTNLMVTPEMQRWPIAALLASGGLLVLLGQAAYRQVPLPQRWAVFALMLLGLLLFFGAGRIAQQPQLPQRRWLWRWLLNPIVRLAHLLRVAPGQIPLLFLALCFGLLTSLAAGPDLVARHALAANAAWFASILLVIAGSLRRGESLTFRIERRDVLLTAVLFIGAFLLRGISMNTIPTTLSGDEGSSGLMAVNFLKGYTDNLFSLGWFSFPSLYFAVQSVGVWLMSNTAAALRLTSALAGALTVVSVYWLARAMFDRPTAGLAALYLLASHYHIHMSRIGLNNIWDGLFATIAMGALWHGWRSGRRTSFLLSGIALGLGQYFYVSIRVLPLLFTIWAAVAFLLARDTFRVRFFDMLLSAYAALIVFLPLAILFVSHPDNFRAPLQRVTIFDGWLENEMAVRGETAVSIIADQMELAALGFTHQPLRLLYDPGAPLLLTGAATLFLIGLAWALLHFDLRYLLLLLPLAAAIIASGFSFDPPASQRYIMSISVAAIIMALSLGQAIAWLRRLWPVQRQIVVIVISMLMIWVAVVDIHYYFFDVYDHYTLGGWNTETATEIAYYLRDQEPKSQQVYFLGAPRMGYYSLSTIPYLAPDMQGEDIVEPLTAPPVFSLTGPTIFVFLPERINELEQVRAAFPNGTYLEFWNYRQQHVFSVYEAVP